MAPHKCSYFRCNNTAEQKSMFCFPWKDANRLKLWLNNCGNMAIAHWSAEKLRSRYLCIDHFAEKYIRNREGQRTRLTRTAVPEHYQAQCSDHSQSSSAGSEYLKVLTPKKVYVNKKNILNITEEPIETRDECYRSTPKRRKRRNKENEDTPKCKKLKIEIAQAKRCIKRKEMKIKSLKNTFTKAKCVNLTNYKYKSESHQIMATMQFRDTKKQWSDKEKKFCMSLYYKSPASYKFMLKSGIVLASPSTIQRWLQETNCLPGLNQDIFNNIKIKFADRPIKERACAVCFDEMSIMVDLQYTSKYDLIEGFEDFGDGNRNQNEAKYVLVFIARGIYTNWKIPLAYLLSSKTVDSDKLRIIVDSVINKLFECGLLPKIIVCDQATSNVKLIKNLGADPDYPFFFVNGRKIFAMFDVPHLIKNIRNNLINSDFELDGNHISFNDIISVYNIDRNNKSKSLKKLTPVHINPNNFQKMKVKYATQILSNSVAGAIKTAIDSGELKSSTAKNTADFIKLCNDLFDCLNSKNKFDSNPYRCAVTKNLNSVVNKTLIKGKDVFSKLKKIYIRNNKIQLTRPPCFDGVVQSINAVLQLSTEEFTPGTGVNFIITYRLNQDVIENLFGIYRIKGGCNKNPTSKLLRSMFRSNLLNNLMKFDQTNCESDKDIFLTTHQNTQLSVPKPSTSSSVSQQDNITDDDVDQSCSNAIEEEGPDTSKGINLEELSHSSEIKITLETCSVVYFAGWLGKSCIDKFDCLDCKKILLRDEVDLNDKKQLLLINRTYSNIITPTLKSPSDYLFDLVSKLLDFFNDNIDKLYKINIVNYLMQNFKKSINFSGDYHDLNHFDYLVRKLFEVKIHDYCKSRKKSLQSASKLRILQNK